MQARKFLQEASNKTCESGPQVALRHEKHINRWGEKFESLILNFDARVWTQVWIRLWNPLDIGLLEKIYWIGPNGDLLKRRARPSVLIWQCEQFYCLRIGGHHCLIILEAKPAETIQQRLKRYTITLTHFAVGFTWIRINGPSPTIMSVPFQGNSFTLIVC